MYYPRDIRENLAPDPRSVLPDNCYGNTRFGVEVEIENAGGVSSGSYWDKKGDGSLRNNGAELVFRMPLAGVDVRHALAEFDELVTEHTTVGMRTSVHVHIDVRDMPFHKLANFIVLYAALESVFYAVSDSKQRYSNIYCPGITANNQAEAYRLLLKSIKDDSLTAIFTSLESWEKYSGLNFKTVATLGSAEFRMHRGSTNSAELSEFVTYIKRLKDKAMSYHSIDSVMSDVLSYRSSLYRYILDDDKYSDVYDRYYVNNICNAMYMTDYTIYTPTMSTPDTTSSVRDDIVMSIRRAIHGEDYVD